MLIINNGLQKVTTEQPLKLQQERNAMLPAMIKSLFLIAALIAPMTLLAMQITISAPNQTFTLEVEPSDSIESVKALIEQQTYIAQARQIITYNGGLLENSRSLSDYNVQKGSVLNVSKQNTVPIISRPSGWKYMGEAGFSEISENDVDLILGNNDTPYARTCRGAGWPGVSRSGTRSGNRTHRAEARPGRDR